MKFKFGVFVIGCVVGDCILSIEVGMFLFKEWKGKIECIVNERIFNIVFY